MAAVIHEKFGRTTSQNTTSETVSVMYLVTGATDENDAKGAVISGAAATITGQKGTLRLTGVRATGSAGSTSRYICEAEYTLPGWEKTTGDKVFTFDTSGGTAHIDFARSEVNKYPGSAPSMSGMINARPDGVDGVDIIVPTFGFTATLYLATGSYTSTYIGNLYALTGKACDANWSPTIDGISMTFLHGEALFLGASGSRRGTGDLEINYHFAASPNVTSLTIGSSPNTITGIAKKGWEYLWVYKMKGTTGTSPSVPTLIPKYAYVDQVYLEGDFSVLGL